MGKHVVILLSLLAVSAIGVVVYKFALPSIIFNQQKSSSDASATKGAISIAVDSWTGYLPLCGREMKKRMRNSGYVLKCVDDNADLPGRMKKLKDGDLDFAVATVDSYLLNGEPEGFPGTICAVIDMSEGGDAIIAKKSKISSLEDLKTKKGWKIAFTPDSPSHHLLKASSVHFDIPALKDKNGAWKVESSGSSDAFKKLKDNKADIAVLWEPDVTKALADKSFVKLLGSEDTHNLIVDVLLVNREFSVRHPRKVRTLLINYFRTLKAYREHPEKLEKEVAAKSKVSLKTAKAMIKGINWVNLTDNAHSWFGIGDFDLANEGLIDTIDSTKDILMETGDFDVNPIPRGDPYSLQNSSFIEGLYNKGISSQFGKKRNAKQVVNSLEKKFSSLTGVGWAALKEIGTLKILPIVFQSGTSRLGIAGKTQLDKAAKNLEHYPNFRIVIKGHTSTRGDKTANSALSKARADSVLRYLTLTYNVDKNRLKAVGFGGDKPLPKKPGESRRRYGYRLPRVELYLMSEVF